MKEFKYTITDPEGIHARPAGELVKICKAYSCNTTIAKGDKKMDCKKIFRVMSLGVKKDMEITLTFDGEDEDAAFEAVSSFLQANL